MRTPPHIIHGLGGVQGFDIYSFLIAIVGSWLLLWAYRRLRRA